MNRIRGATGECFSIVRRAFRSKRIRRTAVTVVVVAVVTVIAAVVIEGCKSRTSPEAIELMNRADAVMVAHPDSALTLLENVDTNAVRGKADRARYALLKSMALDKNYVDTTSFAILQPAIDYYEKHGTPDERLKTRYYEGRIHMNRGDDDAALTSFLRAAEDSALCTDRRALALVYEATGAMYYKQYCVTSFLNSNLKSKKIYETLNDSAGLLRTNLKILEGAILNNDTIHAHSAKANLDALSDKFDLLSVDIGASIVEYYMFFAPEKELKLFLDGYDDISPDSLSFYHKMNMAYAYDTAGEYSKALEYIRAASKEIKAYGCNQADSIKYTSIASGIFEHNNMPEEALEAYKTYITSEENSINDLINSNLLFTQKEYGLKMQSQMELTRQKTRQWVIIASAVALILIAIAVILLLWNRQLKRKVIEFQLEKERDILLKEKDGLLKERMGLMNAMDGLTREKDGLMKTMDGLTREKDGLIKEKDGLTKEMDLLINEKQTLIVENKAVSERIEYLIKERLSLLNGLLANGVSRSDHYSEGYASMVNRIHKDKKKFIASIRDSMEMTNPRFIAYLKEKGLSDNEINYVCLYGIGLRGKDIGIYLGSKGHYNMSSAIRKKLGLQSSETNLGIYISDLLKDATL